MIYAKDPSHRSRRSLEGRAVGLLFLRISMIGDIRFQIILTPCQATVSSQIEDRGSRSCA